MLDAPGAGLAANQIGVPLRVCVVKGDENQIWGLVNPVIVKSAGSQVGYEGCLSKPGWVGEVERYEAVVAKGRNRHAKQVRIKSTAFTPPPLHPPPAHPPHRPSPTPLPTP